MKIRSVLGELSPKSCIQLAMLLLFVPLLMMAQSDRGSITGTVTDPAGATVPNAKVVATFVAT